MQNSTDTYITLNTTKVKCSWFKNMKHSIFHGGEKMPRNMRNIITLIFEINFLIAHEQNYCIHVICWTWYL